jgi:hypothetical protein
MPSGSFTVTVISRADCSIHLAATEIFSLRPHPLAPVIHQTLTMDRATAIEEIRKACNGLSSAITGLHPLIPGLDDKPTQDEIFKALFELTKNVETVKKQLLRLQKRDESAEL